MTSVFGRVERDITELGYQCHVEAEYKKTEIGNQIGLAESVQLHRE